MMPRPFYSPVVGLLVATLGLLATGAPGARAGSAPAAPDTVLRPDSGVTVERLAEGVYAVIRREPPAVLNESNSLLLVGAEDVIVVDAQSSVARTQQTLAALRRITDRPVRAVVHTHWHDDHVFGNTVYRDSFPDVRIVAHAASAEDLASDGARARASFAEGRGGTRAFLLDLVARSRSFAGGPLSEEERSSHLAAARLAEDYGHPGTHRPAPPTVVVRDTLTLRRAYELLAPAAGSDSAAGAAADTARREEVRYRSGEVELAATLHLPAAAAPAPAVVVVHGSGNSDRRNPWTTAYVEALARRGVAVLHPDKRGSGESGGDWRTASFADLARDAAAGIALLRARPEVDASRVGVLAFSQGGYVAAVLAAEDTTTAFAAVVSGGTATLSQQIVDEILLEAERGGVPLRGAEPDTLRALYAGLFAFARDGRGWAALQARVARARASSPRLAAALRTVPPDSTHWALAWTRRTGDFDPIPYWARARRPVALVYGGRDANVRTRASVERLWRAVGPDAPRFSILFLQGNGHALFRDDVVAFLERWIRDGGAS